MKNDFKRRSMRDRMQSSSVQKKDRSSSQFLSLGSASKFRVSRRLAPTSKKILAGLTLVSMVLSPGSRLLANDALGGESKNPISFVNPVSGKGFWAEYQQTQTGVKKLVGKAVPLDLLVFGRWVRANPIATFQDLRQYSPVLKMSPLPIADSSYPNKGTIVLSAHDDVVDALNRSTKLTVRNYTQKMEGSVGPFMLAYDGSQYNVKEKPWMRQMMPKSDLPKVREMVRKLIQESIDVQQYIGRSVDGKTFGRLELVNEIARRVPIRLTGEYFGFPGPSLDKMYEWSRATQDDFFHNVKNDAKVREAAIKAGEEMHSYLGSLIAAKKMKLSAGVEDKADDILSRLVRNSLREQGNDFVDPQSPEDDRIRTNVIGTLVGGVETTQAAITQALNQLFLRPQIFDKAQKAAEAGNVELVAKYVWEALRFQPVNPFVVRYAEEDVTLKSGTIIPKGYHVLIATHSAMFDDSKENYRNPNEFDINRDQSQFFHLGYGSHRCLGDQVALVEVPEVVMALLKLPGLRRASGQDGELDFRRRTAVHALKSDDYETSFPEKFVVEYDISQEAAQKQTQVQVVDTRYAYEDYLMDFDRQAYRECLAGLPQESKNYFLPSVISQNSKRHAANWVTKDNRDLLYCRLNGEFRSCMSQQEKDKQFSHLDGGQLVTAPKAQAHRQAFQICQSKGLTPTEVSFYRHVLLGEELDRSQLSASQAKRLSGDRYAFEDYLKFYDRYTYRECFMNPAGLEAFKDSRDMIMYARLNIDFRLCMGKPILKNRYTGGLLGSDREATYEKCKDGVYNKNTFKMEGRLSQTEKYFYETQILKRNVRFEDLN